MVDNPTNKPDVVVDLEKELMHWATYDPFREYSQSSEQLRREIDYVRGAFTTTKNTLRAAYRIHNMSGHYEALRNVRVAPWRQRAIEIVREKRREEQSELYAWILNTEYGKTVCREYPPHEFVEEYDEEDVTIATWGSQR